MNLTSVVDEFLAAGRARGLSDPTLRAYRQDLTAFSRWVQAVNPDPPFSKQAMLDWIAAMRDRGYAPATIKQRLACLKVLCRWLEDEHRVTDNPFHRLRAAIRLPHRLPRHLKADEISALLTSPPRTSHADPTGHTPHSHVDIRLVQNLLGHASIATTELYTHVADTTLRRTLRAINPRQRLRGGSKHSQ